MEGNDSTDSVNSDNEAIELTTHAALAGEVGTQEVPHSEHSKPLKFAIFIARWPSVICLLAIIVIVIVVFLDSLVFKITVDNGRSFTVEDDIQTIRFDALNLAQEAASKAETESVVPPQSENVAPNTFVLIYRDTSSNWILTKKNIEAIVAQEDNIMKPSGYNKSCKVATTNAQVCDPGAQLSVARKIFNHPNYSKWTINDIKNYIKNETDISKNKTRFTVLQALNKDYISSGKVTMYRTTLLMGYPYPTGVNSTSKQKTSIYKNKFDRVDDQDKKFLDYSTPFWEDLTVNKNGEGKVNNMRMIFYCGRNFVAQFGIIVNQSFVFAILSILFVMFYLWFHLKSLFLAICGILQIMMTFPLAFFIYWYIFQVHYYDSLSTLIIFILLGLGADDIFVFVDAFHQSLHFVDETDSETDQEFLEKRLSYTYRRATKAMFVTQVTTFFAFLATATSSLRPISAFGIWAAIVVASNFALICTVYPAALMLWFKYIRKWEKCYCCIPCVKFYNNWKENRATAVTPKVARRQSTVDNMAAQYRPLEQFLGITFGGFINKYHKFILPVFLIIICISAYGTSTMQEQTGDEQWFRTDHYMSFSLKWLQDFSAGETDGNAEFTLLWGVSGVDRTGSKHWDPKNYGTVTYDNSFDLSPPNAQAFFKKTCETVRNSPLAFQGVAINKRAKCFVDKFEPYLNNKLNTSYPYVSPNPKTQKQDFARVLYGWFQSDPFARLERNVDVRKNGNKYFVKFVQIPIVTNFGQTSTNGVGGVADEQPRWENLVSSIKNSCHKNGATTICNPFLVSRIFASLVTAKAFVAGAIQGIAIAMPLAFSVLLLSTANWILAIFATLDIAGVLVSELAVMAAMGWKFGISESISVVLVIGFSVDYVVHLANAYMEVDEDTREERLKFALLTMGISVVSGAITTFGSGIFLLFPQMLFFARMGIIIMTTIVLSLFWSMFFFTSLLAFLGPQFEQGKIHFRKYLGYCCKKDQKFESVPKESK